MYSREIENHKENLSLNSRQLRILLGSLLGDAHLESQSRPEIARLKIEHSYKQKEYVDWLYKEFKEWVRNGPREKTRRVWGKEYKKYCFTTLSHTDLGNIRKLFYENDKKIVPKELLENYLDELSLAIWFMDDGSVKSKKHKGVFLNTQGFTLREVKKLQEILKENFSIESTTREDKNGEQIYLGSDSGEKFIDTTREYILPCFEYKIPKPLKLT